MTIFNFLIAGPIKIAAVSLLTTSSPSTAILQNNNLKSQNNLGVTNGSNAKSGTAPWFTKVTSSKNPSMDFGLGGALINPWWVLSCAHDVISIKNLGTAVLRFNMYNRTNINFF